jgi:ATP-dependent Clp protease ATP-binding subunit ClpC
MIEYDKELIKILKISEQETIKMHRQYVSTEHIILAVLKSDNHIKNIFNKFNVYYDNYKSLIINNINSDSTSNLISYTPLLKKIILSSIKNNKVTLNNLIINILNEPNTLAVSLLNIIDIDINELYNSIKNGISINYGINLNKERNIDKLYYRENELNELIEALCKKNKSNALLIGEAGVGKTALVELLSQKIEKNEVPKELKNKEIISINMSSLVSGTRYRGEFEEKIENLINSFEKNDRYILFIDEIHTIIGAGGSEGAIDAANILKPYLARNKIKCIGSTKIKEYNPSIKKDKA